VRSRAAASILARGGFGEVHSMEGGIRAWKGLKAAGSPEAGVAHFPPESTPAELTALAWRLEKGTREFYRETAAGIGTPEAAGLFAELAGAESRHQASLYGIYLELSGKTEDPGFPDSVLPASSGPDYLEGGIELSEALAWARGRTPQEILEFALALEVNAYDLHLRLKQRMGDPRAGNLFSRLAGEEKEHLNRLQELFVRSLSAA
jgi:sulfur-carrier protein adenylyltransferase/sulfurtransferase